MSIVWMWAGIGVATGLALFFSLAYEALQRFSRARLEERLGQSGRLDELQRLFEEHEALAQTVGLLRIASVVATACLVTIWAHIEFSGHWLRWPAGVGLALVLTIVFVGAVAMAWSRHAAESVLVATLPVLQACRRAFSPVRQALSLIDSLVRRLLGVSASEHLEQQSHIEEEIRSVVSEGEREGAIEEDQKDMIESVIQFKKEDVTEIMTPRTDIISIPAEATAEEARDLIAESGHSRIPVTETNVDSVVGVLYAKDLLNRIGEAEDAAFAVRDVMREPLFIPETKKLDELLAELQGTKIHMAIVLDEYGGTAGLVTIEDIIEEIFGEIFDEYEEETPQPIRRTEAGTYIVEARVHIDELNHDLDLDLPEDEDFETIGGFVLSRLGTIPKPGEVLDADGLRITVVDAEERRITKLRIDLMPQTTEP